MKRRKTVLLAFSLLTLTALGTSGLTSCSCGDQSNVVPKVIIQGVKNGAVGQTIQLSAIVTNHSSNDVTWSSSDVSIARVDENGLVTLVKSGSVEIIATSVKDPSVQSSPAHITVYAEGEKRLEVVSLPTKTKYKVGEALTYDGLNVMGFSYFNGVKDNTTGEEIALSQLTFSRAAGSTLDTAGTVSITISASGYKSVSFTVTAGENVVERKLYISKMPNTTTYTLKADSSGIKTATFSSRGLEVTELTYVDGELDSRSKLSQGEYTLSLRDGVALTTEGTHTVEVTSNTRGVTGTSFNIMVYTEDTSAYDIIKTLQETKNFTAEVKNNVGTTNDTTGFHYLRRYTENYYDEIEYQNVNNGTEIEFDTTSQKSHIGYTTYNDNGETGIMEYGYDDLNMVVPGRIVATDKTSWWDKASSLSRQFTLFNLSDIPTNTLNGRYLTTVIEVVENDDDQGTQTAAKYPLVASFLDYVGWSSSLITIMNRFTISFNDEHELTMRADFGSYGFTELIVSDIGTTSVPDVDWALENSNLVPVRTVLPEVTTFANVLRKNNYTRVNYSSEIGADKNSPIAFYTEDYMYSDTDNVGYGKVTVNGAPMVQKFKSNSKDEFIVDGEPTALPANKTFVQYVTDQMASENVKGYLTTGMSTIFGDGSTNTGLLNTFNKNNAMTIGTMATYQSFDDNALQSLIDYIGAGTIQDQSFWVMITHELYEDSNSYLDENNFRTIELWNMNAVSLSGYVMAFMNFGTTSVDWIEAGLSQVETTANAQEALALN